MFLRLGEENRFLHVKRCAALTAGTLAACCVNPWGTRLLTYTFTFLTSGGWMKQLIDEHKPPAFGEENALYPEVLIVLTIMLVVELLRRGRFSLALLLAAWTHAALTSIRHAPIPRDPSPVPGSPPKPPGCGRTCWIVSRATPSCGAWTMSAPTTARASAG